MKKYNNEVEIKAPLAKVIELFNDSDNLIKWQPGFVSMTHLSGDFGEVGSTYRLLYKIGKRNVDMIETITAQNANELYAFTYVASGVWNEVVNHFEIIDENTTKYWTESEFKFKGTMRIIGALMPNVFKKQSQKYLDLFKEFVEKELSAS